MKVIDAKNKSVLFLSDLHFCFEHKDAFRFLEHLKKKVKPDIIIGMGDTVDYHAISFHEQDQSGEETLTAGQELKRAIAKMQRLYKLFKGIPCSILSSNHGNLVYRKMRHNGLPLEVLKPLHELYGTPGWTWHEDILLKTNNGDVYCHHGKTSNGEKATKDIGCSTVQAHFHSKFSIQWFDSPLTSRFSMYVGCLVDQQAYAFAYAKNQTKIFQIGTGSLDKNGIPHLHKMKLNKRGRWSERSKLGK